MHDTKAIWSVVEELWSSCISLQSNRAPHTCLKIDARKAFGDSISDKQSMKSLAVTGIISEMQRKGATKHCCDQGFGFSRLNLQ